MHIRKIHTEKEWENILSYFSDVSFLQSWTWGEFQNQLGNEVDRVAIYQDNHLIASLQYYIVKSRLFTYLYCPRALCIVSDEQALFLLDIIQREAKKKSVDFVLVEPDRNFKRFINYARSNQPMHTSIVSLTQTAEILFAKLRKTTRALIRKAKEANVEIIVYTDLGHFDDFAKLFSETAKRQRFIGHSFAYIKKQFSLFSKDGKAKLYLANINNVAVAGAIIVSYRHTSTYLHAATSSQGRKSGASHLLVWTAITEAKKKGSKQFDLWGIAPDDNPNHPWRGITLFKQGYGGAFVTYPGSFVLPINTVKFNIYRFVTFLRTAKVCRIAHRMLSSRRSAG